MSVHNKFNHLMVDLETTSTKQNTFMLTIGAVVFNPRLEKTGKEFYRKVDINSYERAKRRFDVDINTIEWWMKQNEDARREAFLGDDRDDILDVLNEFIDFYKDSKISKIWSHGKEFDIKILEYHFDIFDYECPWKYWETMDTRTLYALSDLDYRNISLEDVDIKHNALYDCKRQIKAVNICYKNIANDNK